METARVGAIVVSWAAAIPGRESTMLAILKKAVAYLSELRRQNQITDVRVFVPKIGSFRDTLLICGRLDALMSLLVESDFETLLVEGTIVVQDLRLEVWEGGSPEWMAQRNDPYVERLHEYGFL